MAKLEKQVTAPQLDPIIRRLNRLSAQFGAMERFAERIDALEQDRLDNPTWPSDLHSNTTYNNSQEWRQDSAAGTTTAYETTPTRIRPRYAEINTYNSAVTVEQNENGSLFVRNTDPEMTMQVLWVDAERPDGSFDDIFITVPPPDEW